MDDSWVGLGSSDLAIEDTIKRDQTMVMLKGRDNDIERVIIVYDCGRHDGCLIVVSYDGCLIVVASPEFRRCCVLAMSTESPIP